MQLLGDLCLTNFLLPPGPVLLGNIQALLKAFGLLLVCCILFMILINIFLQKIILLFQLIQLFILISISILESLDLLLKFSFLSLEISNGSVLFLVRGLGLLDEVLSLLKMLLDNLFKPCIFTLEALDPVLECFHCLSDCLGLCSRGRQLALLLGVLPVKRCARGRPAKELAWILSVILGMRVCLLV